VGKGRNLPKTLKAKWLPKAAIMGGKSREGYEAKRLLKTASREG